MGNNTSAGPTAGTELCSPDSASIYSGSGSGSGSGSDSNNYAQQLVPVTSSRSIFIYHVAEPTATNRIHGDKEGIGCFTRYYLQASHIKHASRDKIAGLCASCIGMVADTQNNMQVIMSVCGFPSQQYSPDKDKLASNIWVKATRPTAGVKTNGASRSTRLASIGVYTTEASTEAMLQYLMTQSDYILLDMAYKDGGQ
ncbi:hypothetical protein MKX07_005112 [Trichoderma sp. CBMAI-0711]|nr:hypothetical protein MKX07_005112 [Trichoderma sp. CBMAI-0711]